MRKLSFITAKIAIPELFPNDRVTLRDKPCPAVFFNDEPIARYHGLDWSSVFETILANLAKSKQEEPVTPPVSTNDHAV